MATAPVRVVPSSTKYRYKTPTFDRHQFVKTGYVPAENLAYSDRTRMRVIRRGQHGRRIETPAWAMNFSLLRVMITRFMERRANIPDDEQIGSLKQRLERAEKKLAARIPAIQARLNHFIHEYKHVQEQHISNKEKAERLEELAVEIKGKDTQIRLLQKPGGVAAAVAQSVHLYYGLGWDSVAVVNEILPGLSPTWLHQTMYGLNHCAKEFLGETNNRTTEDYCARNSLNAFRSFIVES
jgi:hypothetical protein